MSNSLTTSGRDQIYGTSSFLGFVWNEKSSDLLNTNSHFYVLCFEPPLYWEEIDIIIILSFLTLFICLYVIYYFFFSFGHIKFRFYKRKYYTLIIHAISGTLEFVFLYVSFFSTNNILWPIYLACLFDLVHDITAYFQLFGTFGNKYAMVSGYFIIVTYKLLLNIWLFLSPLSYQRWLHLFLAHSVFAFVRIFYTIFQLLDIFTSTLYSSSMVIGYIMSVSIIGGWRAVLIILTIHLISILVLRITNPKFVIGITNANRMAFSWLNDDKFYKLNHSLNNITSESNRHKEWQLFYKYFFHLETENLENISTIRLSFEQFTRCLMESYGFTIYETEMSWKELDGDKYGYIMLKNFEEKDKNTHWKFVLNEFIKDVKVAYKSRISQKKTKSKLYQIIRDHALNDNNDIDATDISDINENESLL